MWGVCTPGKIGGAVWVGGWSRDEGKQHPVGSSPRPGGGVQMAHRGGSPSFRAGLDTLDAETTQSACPSSESLPETQPGHSSARKSSALSLSPPQGPNASPVRFGSTGCCSPKA